LGKNQKEVVAVLPGVTREILASGKNIMVAKFSFAKGAEVPVHSHPHEQCSYIREGSFTYTLNGQNSDVQANDCMLVPPGTPHGAIAKEEGIIIDVFSPPREDFLATTSHEE